MNWWKTCIWFGFYLFLLIGTVHDQSKTCHKYMLSFLAISVFYNSTVRNQELRGGAHILG